MHSEYSSSLLYYTWTQRGWWYSMWITNVNACWLLPVYNCKTVYAHIHTYMVICYLYMWMQVWPDPITLHTYILTWYTTMKTYITMWMQVWFRLHCSLVKTVRHSTLWWITCRSLWPLFYRYTCDLLCMHLAPRYVCARYVFHELQELVSFVL
jgi:hypothetical protein